MDFISHFAATAPNQTTKLSQQTELQTLVEQLRPQLGPQAYLLNNYLLLILEICNEVTLLEAANDGFNYFAELRKLCRTIMEGASEAAGHPFYAQAKAYIGQHPLPYQERSTRLNLYCLLLSGVFMEQAIREYALQVQQRLEKTFDTLHLANLRQQMCEHLQEPVILDQLDQWMREYYLAVTPVEGFAQGLMHEILYILTSTDPETGQTLLQLWFKEQSA